MKAKKNSKTKTRSKAKVHRKTRTRAKPRTRTSQPSRIEPIPNPSVSLNPPLKVCQEIEVGDIGGFGSLDELEEHEKRCSEAATEFCTNCGKNLCHNHYDLLHRDHDRTSGQASSTSLA